MAVVRYGRESGETPYMSTWASAWIAVVAIVVSVMAIFALIFTLDAFLGACRWSRRGRQRAAGGARGAGGAGGVGATAGQDLEGSHQLYSSRSSSTQSLWPWHPRKLPCGNCGRCSRCAPADAEAAAAAARPASPLPVHSTMPGSSRSNDLPDEGYNEIDLDFIVRRNR